MEIMHNAAIHYILPGRFQPFHNDHLQIVKEYLKLLPGTIFLGIIVHTSQKIENISKFEEEAMRHNSIERNPFTPTDRIIMISDCMKNEVRNSDRILPLMLPRPEANWELIKNMFDGQRIWLVPDVDEEFDNMKAEYFESKGDNILRIKLTPTVSGYSIRKAIFESTDTWKKDVPSTIVKHVTKILEGGCR